MSAQGSSQTASLPVVLLTRLHWEITNMVTGDQFVLEPLLERLICDIFCQRRALHECPRQLLLHSFLCNSLAWQFSQMCRQLSQYLN